MSKKFLLAGAAALAMLGAGCGGGLDLKPAGDPNARLQGQGFSALPPPGPDWYLVEAAPDGVQFVKLEGVPPQDLDKAPHTFFAGVFPLPANGAANASDAEFKDKAETLLTGYFSQARRTLKTLSVSPYPGKQGLCVQYDSVQVQQRSVQNPVRQPLEFRNHGFVCRHSPQSQTWIHGVYTHRYFIGTPDEVKPATVKEAEAFLQNVELTGP